MRLSELSTNTDVRLVHVQDIVYRIHVNYRETKFMVAADETGRIWLWLEYTEPDIRTGEPTVQKSRTWQLSPKMTESEIVKTAWLCLQQSDEHRRREGFLYRGRRIFSPHLSVQAMWEMAARGQVEYGLYAEDDIEKLEGGN